MRGHTVLVAGVMLALLPGCTGSSSDKAGGRDSRPLVLTMANGDGSPGEVQAFADALARLSRGRMRIEFQNDWRAGQTRFEAGLIVDVRRGKVDLGWVGSRAWDTVGVTSFQALQAPFLIDSYPLEAEVLESSIPREMLRAIEPIGLVGIGVLPGPLRKPYGLERPLARPADFAGARFGIIESNVARETLHALGAKAVAIRLGSTVGPIDGYEQARGAPPAKYISVNVNLWPRPLVIFTSRRTFAALSRSERELLRQAAKAAISQSLATVQAYEAQTVAVVCRARLKLVTATAADLAELRAAVAPVYRALEQNTETRSYIRSITAMRRRLGVGGQPLSCAGVPSREASTAIPSGTYSGFSTSRDARREGLPASDTLSRYPIIHRTVILRPTRVVLKETYPDGHTEIGWDGAYSVYRDRIVLTNAGDGYKVTARWSFDGKELRFTHVGPAGGDAVVWGSHPWVKIG
jgi:TRAP-type C4-dicarboxylate transport system substrate-binding protein